MGKRKVGDEPFDLESFFEVLDSLEDKKGPNGPDDNFKNHFMPVLRHWSLTTIEKPEPKRHHLAKVVGDACHQTWRRLNSNKPYPFTDVKWRSKADVALTSEQNAALQNTAFNTPSQLIAYLKSVHQMPQAHIPASRPLRKGTDSTLSQKTQPPTAQPTAPQPERSPKATVSTSCKPLKMAATSSPMSRFELRPRKSPQQGTKEQVSREQHSGKTQHVDRKQQSKKQSATGKLPSHAHTEQGETALEQRQSSNSITVQITPIEKLDVMSDAGSTPSPSRNSSPESSIVVQHNDLPSRSPAEQEDEVTLFSSPIRLRSHTSTPRQGSEVEAQAQPHQAPVSDHLDNTAPLFTFGDSSMNTAVDLPVSSADLYHWAEPVPGRPGHFVEAPKLPGCGPWEIPLPRNMDPRVYFIPYHRQVQSLLLGVPLKWNPKTWTISLLKDANLDAHELENKADSFEVQYIISTRWRAYRIILAWVYHLRDHAQPPSASPMGILDFVQAELIKDGNATRDSIIKHMKGVGGRPVFPGRDYQLPTLQSSKRKQAAIEETFPGPEPQKRLTARNQGVHLNSKEASPFTLPDPKPKQTGPAAHVDQDRSSKRMPDTFMETLRRLQVPKLSADRAHQQKRRRTMHPFDSDDDESQTGGLGEQTGQSKGKQNQYRSTPQRESHTNVEVKEEPLERELRLHKELEELEERQNPWYLDGSRQ